MCKQYTLAAGFFLAVGIWPTAGFGQVTFDKDIAPLLFARCGVCHHPEGSAPFSLLTYQAARQHATQIALVTKRRLMPPWKAEPGYEEFVGLQPLSDAEIDLILTAIIANEHVLLVGPPGCAKSLMLDAILSWTGGIKFAILLTKFSVPEEVIGPVSLTGLKEDRYVRITTGKLPEADFAFIDETFKGSSAILNSLLKILNERAFDAGDGVVRTVPLKLC